LLGDFDIYWYAVTSPLYIFYNFLYRWNIPNAPFFYL